MSIAQLENKYVAIEHHAEASNVSNLKKPLVLRIPFKRIPSGGKQSFLRHEGQLAPILRHYVRFWKVFNAPRQECVNTNILK
jgi:hypothetical protein